MMLRRVFVAMLAMAACFSAQARAPEVPPVPIAAQLAVEMIRGPNEMRVTVPQTASAIGFQFGLIGGLIGTAVQNAQTKKAEERMVPLRNLLVTYHFNDKIEAAVRARLASEGISPDPLFSVRDVAWHNEPAGSAAGMPAEALVLVPNYAMDYDFGQVSVTLAAMWVKRSLKSNGKVKAQTLMARNYAVILPMRVGTETDRDGRWASLGSERLAGMLDQSIEQMAQMLAYDFSPEGRAGWQASVDKNAITRLGSLEFPGQSVREGNGWVWVRSGKKWTTLTGYHPITESTFMSVPVPVAATDSSQTTHASPAPVAAETDNASTVAAGDRANVAMPAAPVEAPTAPTAPVPVENADHPQQQGGS